MTLLNLFSLPCPRGATEHAPSDDRSIMLMVVLLLGLVFAPIIGLHVAAVAFGPARRGIPAGQPRPPRARRRSPRAADPSRLEPSDDELPWPAPGPSRAPGA